MRWLALSTLLLAAAPLHAQDSEPGFFGRLFGGGGDTAEAEEDPGGFLERLIEDNLSGEGRDVRIRGFQGVLSSEATLESLTISDEEGVWLTLNDVTLDWNRSALLRGALEVTELSAAEIILPRLPAPAEAEPMTPEAQGFSLPELPVSIAIERIAAERVEIGQPVFGAEAVVSLSGSVTLDEGEGVADLDIVRLDGEGQLILDAAYSNDSEVLSLALDLTEGPEGILVSLIDLPGRPAIEFEVMGEAPIDAYAADIRLATDGVERLSGRFVTGEPEGEGTFRVALDLSGDLAPVFAPAYQPFFGSDVILGVAVTTFEDGSLALEELDVRAEALELTGRALIGPDRLPREIDLDGRVAGTGPVLLPLPGPETRVDQVDLAVTFDAQEGDRWTGTFRVDGLDRPGFSAQSVDLVGEGVIVAGETPRVTATLDFNARSLDLGDPAAKQALGERVTGAAAIEWTGGAPVRLSSLTIEGETYALDGHAQIDGTDDGPRVSGQATLRADDLSEFSGIADRTLAGRASLVTEFDVAPLAGFLDVAVEGTTENLVVSQEQADRILAGTATLRGRFERDGAGIRATLETLETPNASLTGRARLTSNGSEASIAGAIADASILLPQVSGPVRLSGSATEASGIWSWNVDAGLEGTRLVAEGTARDLTGVPVVVANGTLDAEDLSDFSDLAGRELDGAVDTRFALEATADLSRVSLRVEGQTVDLRIGDPRVDPLLAGLVRHDIDATRAGSVVTLRNSTISGPEVELAASAIIAGEESRFEISGRVTEAATLLVGAPAGPLTLSASGRQDGRDWNIDVEAEATGLALDAEGAVLDPTGAAGFDGRVSARVDDLSVLSRLASRELAGRIGIEASGNILADLSRFDLTASFDGADVRIGEPALDRLLRGDFDGAATARRDGDDRLTVDRLVVRSEALTLEALGTATGLTSTPVIEGRLDAAAPDLSLFAELAGRDLGGALTVEAEGSAAADLSRFDLDATLAGRDLRLGVPQADPVLAGELSGAVSAAREGDTLTVRRLTLETAAIELDTRGVANGLSGTPAVEGEVRAEVSDLAILSQLAGRDLGGSLAVEASGSGAFDASRFDVDATLRGLEVRTGIAEVDPLLAGPLDAEIVASRDAGGAIILRRAEIATAAIDVEANGRVEDVETNPVFDGSLSSFIGDLSVLSAATGLSLGGELSLDAAGRVAADLSQFDLEASAEGAGVRTGIAAADDLLAGDLRARLDATRSGDDMIVVDGLGFSTTLLNLTGEGTIGPGGSTLALDARIADIAPFVDGFSGPVTANGTIGQAGDGRLLVDIDATGPGGSVASLTGSAARDFSTVDLNATGRAPLGLANRFIIPRTLAGTVGFDISVIGPPGLESVSGTISTQGARLVAPTFNVALNDISSTITLAGGQAQLNVAATVQNGGRLSVSGPLGLVGGLNAGLDIRLDSVVLRDPRLYETRVTGALRVAGPLAGGATISGDLALGETIVRIPSSGLGGGGAVPDILHLNEPPPVRATRARAGLIETEADGAGDGGGGPVYGLAISLTAPNQVFVRGRGLEAEFGGRLRIAGTTANVVPSGAFELIRGRLDILGQRLAIDEATISLQGSFVPVVRIRASTDAEEYRINIIVSGSVTDPDIRFTSDPDLPEEEVLARLIFGRGLENLSPIQAARLALAVRTLSGRGGEGLVGDIRDGAGLADLDITTDEEGNAAVRAGAYLTENVYTDVTVGATGEAELNLNLDLSPSVTVKGSVSNTGDTSIGIFYERDY